MHPETRNRPYRTHWSSLKKTSGKLNLNYPVSCVMTKSLLATLLLSRSSSFLRLTKIRGSKNRSQLQHYCQFGMKILCCGACLMHCRAFWHAPPHLYPLGPAAPAFQPWVHYLFSKTQFSLPTVRQG